MLAAGSVGDSPWAVHTTAHEFFHGVQHATGNFAYEDDAAWYWEATATWIEAELYPDSATHGVFVFGYAMLPELSVEFFDYADSGDLTEFHQYGAFIFPKYITEFVSDWSLIRDTWVAPHNGTGSPLEAIRGELEQVGVDFNDVFRDFSAHNVTWDYQYGDDYQQFYQDYAAYYSASDDHRVAASHGGVASGWVDGPGDLAPQRYGYNIIELGTPLLDSYTVEVDGEPTSYSGDSVDWHAVVVLEMEDWSTSYEPLHFSDGVMGSVTVSDLDLVRKMFLVVAPSLAVFTDSEMFKYKYRVGSVGAGDDIDSGGETVVADSGEKDEPTGCACDSTTDGSSSSLVSLFLSGIYVISCGFRRRRVNVAAV